MSLDVLKATETIEALENFLKGRRPPEEMRNELDIGYKIENQSVIIYDIRPFWRDKSKIIEEPIAKTTWIHTRKVWKIYWMRSDLKWHSYQPKPHVKTIDQFIQVVDEDAHGCFWG